MDRKKQLKEALNRLSKLDYSTPPDIRYQRIEEVVTQVEGVAREIAVSLVQKVIDVLKIKEQTQAQTEPVKAETSPVVETEVVKDDNKSN